NRHLYPMAGIAHGIMHAVSHTRARQPILRHVDEAAPAIIDARIGDPRKDLAQLSLKDDAALQVRCRARHRKARPPAEDETVVGGQPEVITDVLAGGAGPPARHDGRRAFGSERLRHDDETPDRHDPPPEPAERTVLRG